MNVIPRRGVNRHRCVGIGFGFSMPARERQPAGGSFDEAGDATRRTRLANERTYLAWWRTGLTAFAVSVGTGKIVPVLATGSTWSYTAIGIGFALIGVFARATRFGAIGRSTRPFAAGSSPTLTNVSSPCSPAPARY
jgi:uncharacterized membrane protein YidH (DUF202 family)